VIFVTVGYAAVRRTGTYSGRRYFFSFLPARRSQRGHCYGDVTGWVAGWLDVTRRYCIKTAKPIWKLFRPSECPIIQFFETLAPTPNSKGNPFSEGVKYTGWEIGDFRVIFDGNPLLYPKQCEIGRWLLWNVNRKSWVPIRMV